MRRRGHFDDTGRADEGVSADYGDKFFSSEDSRVFGGTTPDQVTVRPTQPTPLEQAAAPKYPSYGEPTVPTYSVKPPQSDVPSGLSPSGYGAAAPSAVAAQSASKYSAQGERPMVFALRSDPSLYVYEFSDRLEFYRNTHGGMLLCNVEYKRR